MTGLPHRNRARAIARWLCIVLMVAAVASIWIGYGSTESRHLPPAPRRIIPLDTPAVQAVWPLLLAQRDTPHLGMTHWLDTLAPDGTSVDLFEFDFTANPKLRIEIYDQDEDDDKPFDNRVLYWNNSVGAVTHHLNSIRRGPVLAAWNGLFFDLNGQGPNSIASHLTPVVLDGKLHYADLPTYRWIFGVRYHESMPEFNTLLMPGATEIGSSFDFAAGAAQCVVKGELPLKLQPFPVPGGSIAPSHPTAADEAGYIPIVDHMKVSRTSLAWSKDSSRLYLLFVKAPTTETESALALKHDEPISGGWTLADVQRFWMAKGVWCAINSDGGGPAQLTYLRKDGNYTLIPARWAADSKRMSFTPEFKNAPAGGSLMYFYVRERSK